ncbi:sigma-70 family RNA polymerase sigma factor [Denitratisoma sp. agr-D3]
MSIISPSNVASDPIAGLYHDHHGWLRNWLRLKLGCAERAADFAHDTFLRILSSRSEQLEHVREPRAFLTTIAHGLVVDFYRRRELEKAWLESLAHQPEATAPSPEQQHLILEALLEVDRLLDGLAPKVRAAWLMSRLDGLGHAEIAAELGVSVSRVRQYLATGARHCYQLRFGAVTP